MFIANIRGTKVPIANISETAEFENKQLKVIIDFTEEALSPSGGALERLMVLIDDPAKTAIVILKEDGTVLNSYSGYTIDRIWKSYHADKTYSQYETLVSMSLIKSIR